MDSKWYVRCVDCLSIGVVSEIPQKDWTCGLCGGHVETMGKVTLDGKRLEEEREKAACDARCTHARGPLCVCKCNCANHGTGRTVVVRRDLGPVPVIDMKEEDRALEKAEGWRRNLQIAREKWLAASNNIKLERERTGRYSVPYDMFMAPIRIKKLMEGAKEARTWKARDKRVAECMAIPV